MQNMYIRVAVVAGAKKEEVTRVSDDRYDMRVREPAERNLANGRVRELLAREFKVSAKAVRLVAGHRSPRKVFSITID